MTIITVCCHLRVSSSMAKFSLRGSYLTTKKVIAMIEANNISAYRNEEQAT